MSNSYFGQYNERFTIVDVDGIILASPLDELDIPYPENFGLQSFTSERDIDYRSHIKEFQNAEELKMIFDRIASDGESYSPYTFIKALLDASGFDARANLRAYRTPIGGVEGYREYKMNLDSAIKRDIGYEIRIKRVKFNDKLRTRKELGVNVESSENLDGIADTALTLIEKPMHSRAVLLEYEADYVTTEEVESITYDSSYYITRGSTGSGGYMNIGYRNVIRDELETTNNETSAWHAQDDLLPWFTVPENGFYDFAIRITTEDNLSDANFENPDNVVLRFVTDGTPTDHNLSKSTLPSGGVDIVTYSIFEEYELQKGTTVFLYFYDALNKPFFHTPVLDASGVLFRDDYATVDGLTYSEPSMASGHFIYETLNKVIQKIIGDESYNPLKSTLLERTEQGAGSDGDASLNFVTTGNKVRGLTNSLIVDFNNLVDFCVKRFNAGMALITDSGNQKVLIERSDHFFQDVQIMKINEYTAFEETHDGKNIFNEVEVGYNKYADPNEQGTIQGFNTIRGYNLPVESVKKKKTITMNVITDDMEIERIRRIDKKTKESDQSDEDVIIVQCRRFNSGYRIRQSSVDEEYNHGNPVRQAVEFDGANTITLHGYYLKGQIDSATEIDVGVQANCALALTEATLTIDNIIYDKANNQTVITTVETLASTAIYTCYAFNFDVDVIIPERVEGFEDVDGLVDKYSVYNLRHVPSAILFEWFPMIGFTFNEKAGTKKVKFSRRRNNVDVAKKGGKYTGTDLITESSDFTLTVLRGYNDTYLNRKYYRITTHMNYDDELIQIIDSLNGDHASTNWGYVSVDDLEGIEVQFYPDVLSWNLEETEVQISGWGKRFDANTPSTPQTDCFNIVNRTLVRQQDLKLVSTSFQSGLEILDVQVINDLFFTLGEDGSGLWIHKFQLGVDGTTDGMTFLQRVNLGGFGSFIYDQLNITPDGSRLTITRRTVTSQLLGFLFSVNFDLNTLGTVRYHTLTSLYTPTAGIYNSDGTKFLSSSGLLFRQHNFATPYDPNTLSDPSISKSHTSPQTVAMKRNNDDTAIITLEIDSGNVYLSEWTYGTAGDLTTLTKGTPENFGAFSGDDLILSFSFNKNGRRLFLASKATQTINEYALTCE